MNINEKRTKLKQLSGNITHGSYKDAIDESGWFQHWYGDDVEDSYKGTAIFTNKSLYNIEIVENFNKEFRYVVPYKFIPLSEFTDLEEYVLLSIWTKQPSDGSSNYQKTIFDALDYYNFNKPIILAGDFNTGGNSKYIVRYEELKTKLDYHGLKNCAENTSYEYEPTFFHDNTNDYFVNDFCFIPKHYNVYNFQVDKMDGQKRWHDLSDHCPIIADFGKETKEELREIEKTVEEALKDLF